MNCTKDNNPFFLEIIVNYANSLAILPLYWKTLGRNQVYHTPESAEKTTTI